MKVTATQPVPNSGDLDEIAVVHDLNWPAASRDPRFCRLAGALDGVRSLRWIVAFGPANSVCGLASARRKHLERQFTR